MTRTAMQAIDVAGPVCGGCQSRRRRAYSPETACPQPMPPTAIRRSILIEGGARPFLLPPRFHGAPGVEAACRHRGQNSRANNELAGAPGRIRTSDPQIRSLDHCIDLVRFFCKPDTKGGIAHQYVSWPIANQVRYSSAALRPSSTPPRRLGTPSISTSGPEKIAIRGNIHSGGSPS